MLQAMGAGAVDIGSVGNAPPVFAAAGGDKHRDRRRVPGQPARLRAAGAEELADPLGRPAQGQADRGGPGQLGRLPPAHRAEEGRADGARRHPGLPAARRRPGRAGLRPRGRLGHLVARSSSRPRPRTTPGSWSTGSVTAARTRSRWHPAAALADPAKAAAIRDYLKLLDQAHAWAATHQAAWAAVWAKATGLPDSHHGQGGQGRRGPRGADHPGGGQRPSSRSSNAFTTAGLIPGHVDFSKFVDTAFNSTAGGTS